MQNKPAQIVLRTCLLYGVAGVLWILLSDWALSALAPNSAVVRAVQTYKGLGFIAVTTLLLYWIMRRQLGRWTDEADERRLAQQALSVSETHYRFLFDNMLEGVAHCRMLFEDGKPRDFVYLDVNRAFRTLTGLENVVGKSVLEVIPGIRESNPDLFEAYGRVAATGNPEVLETYVPPLNIWFSISVYSPRNEHFVAVFENITERRQAECALRESEERLHLALAASGMGVWEWDIRTDAIYWSPECFVILGVEDSYGTLQSFANSVHPDDREAVVATAHRALAKRTDYSMEFRNDRPEGQQRWFSIYARVKYGVDGSAQQLVGTAQDITDRKLAEAALRQSGERFRAMFENASVGVAQSDMVTRRFLWVNDRMCSIAGRSAEELLALRPIDITHPEDREREGALTRRLLEGAISDFRLEKRYVRRDDSVAWVNVNVTAIRDASGRPERSVAVIEDITARKQAEAALRESEARYRQLFDEAIEGLALADTETGELLDCNQAFLRLTGYERNEVIGRSQIMLHPPDESRRPFSPSFAKHREDRAGELTQDLLLTKSGRILDVEIKANHIETGGRKAMIGAFHDITETRRGQREREITLDLLRRLNAPGDLRELVQAVLADLQRWTACEAVGIRLHDGDDYPYFETRGFPSEFVRLENHLCQRDLKGQIVRDSLGHAVVECMCGNILCGRFNPALPFFTQKGSFWSNGTTELLASTTAADRQVRTRNRCNGEGYESVALIPLIHGGRTVGLLQVNDRAKGRFTPELLAFLEQMADQIAVAIAHRQAEEALHESEKLYRALVENAAEVVMVIQNGMIQFINPEGEVVSGYTRQELMSRPFLEFCYPLDRERIAANHMHRLKGEPVPDGAEARMVRKDGTRRDLQIRAARIMWKGAPATLNFLTDVTEQKRADEERQRMQAELEQTRKMEAVGQLAGGVAHDFNNLLTVIQGYSGMLLTDLPPGDPNREAVGDIHDAGERAASLTRQLLAFSRKQVLESKVLNLNEVVSNVEKMLRRLIGENIVLTTILSPTVSCVKVDPGQLEQVVINLAVNARDAMPGGGRLTIETNERVLDDLYCRQQPDSHCGRYVRLSITDTGQGMSPEIQQRIFEPFFTTKEIGKGTGLGLATVFGIVKQSNGFIEVRSEVGAGSSFRIHLPALDPAETASRDREASASAPHGTETILLVEDEKSVRRVASRALRAYGYQVIEKENAQAAIDFLQDFQLGIDLLLTDVVMPGMSGPQLAQSLREKQPYLKVIFMSGYTDDAMFQQDGLAANTAFLRKPFVLVELARKVRTVLDE